MPATLVEKFEDLCDFLQSKLFDGKRPLFLFSLLCLILLAIFLNFREADPDLFARLAVGRLIDTYGQILKQDPFAYTPTNPVWYDHEWLSGLIFFKIFQVGRDLGLFAAKCLLAFVSLFFLMRAQQPKPHQNLTSFLWIALCVAPLSAIWNSTIRSHIFTFLFLAVFFWALKEFKSKKILVPLYFLPFVMVFWANAHGGFVLGLILLAINLLDGQSRKPIGLVLTFCTIATLLNPYGLAYWSYIISALSMQRPLITEWLPTNILEPQNWLFDILALISFWPATKNLRSFFKQPQNLFLAFCFYAALKHTRFVPLFAATTLVYSTESFYEICEALRIKFLGLYQRLSRSLSILGAGFLLLSFVQTAEWLFRLNQFSLDYQEYPQAALSWLKKNYSGGRLLVDFNNGSYALWQLYPNFKVSMDGRFEEVYPMSTYWAVLKAFDVTSVEHRASFQNVQPDFVLLAKNSPSYQIRQAFAPECKEVYADTSYALLYCLAQN